MADQDAENPRNGVNRWQRFRQWQGLIGDFRITPVWMSDGTRFAFVDLENERVAAVDPMTGTVTDLFDPVALNDALARATRHRAPVGLAFATFELADEDGVIRFSYRDTEWLFNVESYELRQIPVARLEAEARAKPGTQPAILPQIGWFPVPEVLSPDGRFIATSDGPDLALRSTQDGRIRRLTDDGEELFRWSLSSLSTSGFAPMLWSPNSRSILAAKTDWRGVPAIPHVSWLGRNETVSLELYPRAGERMEVECFHVIDIMSGRLTPLELPIDPERHHIRPIRWIGDDQIMLMSHDHGGNRAMLILANAATGASSVIVDEPYSIARFGYARGVATGAALRHLVGDGTQFLWMSDRDGWNHVYLYNMDGTVVRQLTSGTYPVESVERLDPVSGTVYFMARADPKRPYDTHLCQVGLNGSDFKILTRDTGEHRVHVSPRIDCFLDMHSTVDRPHRNDLRDMNGDLITTLTSMDTSRLDSIGWTAPQEFCVKAADGSTDIYGVLFFPPNFDPSRTYPVVECIYGGPQCQAHPNSFELSTQDISALPSIVPEVTPRATFGTRAQALAQLGFVTLVLDGRGTPGRSRDFQQIAYGKMGQHEIADHGGAIRQIADTRPWIDLTRVGVCGGSWGGYLTIRALLQGGDLYKVGVASASVAGHDDNWGGCMPLHGEPNVRPDAYRLGNSLDIVDRLTGKLLLIHGTHDKNSPFASAMKLVHAFARAGKAVDTMFLADMGHIPRGWQTLYVQGLEARYLVEHLYPDGIDPDDIPLSEG